MQSMEFVQADHEFAANIQRRNVTTPDESRWELSNTNQHGFAAAHDKSGSLVYNSWLASSDETSH
ncbi:unnamed protein product [Amoebophrya sp. A120]|nr:unnamed protein product [Amoebophrya sp. A120]|eukprot:GSA120T00020413001.1